VKKLSPEGSELVGLRMPPAEVAQIDRAAELRQETRSKFIRAAIRRGREELVIETLIAEVDKT